MAVGPFSEKSRGVDSEFRFHVVNPGGRDAFRDFPAAQGSPYDPGHPPVNYHAYAACTSGVYARSAADLPPGNVLLLLRPKHLVKCLRSLRELKQGGRRVYISWKESGLSQVSEVLVDASRWEGFRAIAAEADGFVSSTPDLIPVYEAAGCKRGGFIPTPYPVAEPAWDFSLPLAERNGVFLGTREFSHPARNHLLALATLAKVDVPVTLINTEGRSAERLIRAVHPSVRIVAGRLPYVEYLKLMSTHRIVFQIDRSAVPGQVAGDTLLCRMPCVGGDGAIDRLVFPGLHSAGRGGAEVLAAAQRLLSDDQAWEAGVESSQERGRELVSFKAVAQRLKELCR